MQVKAFHSYRISRCIEDLLSFTEQSIYLIFTRYGIKSKLEETMKLSFISNILSADLSKFLSNLVNQNFILDLILDLQHLKAILLPYWGTYIFSSKNQSTQMYLPRKCAVFIEKFCCNLSRLASTFFNFFNCFYNF